MEIDRHQYAAILVMLILAACLSACQKPEGPAQKAGKAIDHAAAQAGKQIEKAGDKVRNTAKGDD